MITTSHETLEGKLTEAVDKYCDRHNYPLIAGVNGPRVKGWKSIPDRIMGKETDDVYTKCIVIEIKPKINDAIKDLKDKEKEYKEAKYLAAIGCDNQGKRCGILCSYRKPTGELSFEKITPIMHLEKFLDYLYNNVYQAAHNPIEGQIVAAVHEAEKQGHAFEDILNVVSGSFVDETLSTPLSFSLKNLRKLCNKLKRPCDKIEVLHTLMFDEDSREERYKLGQFITEYPHSLHIAEEVIKIFDKHQDLVIYEPCVGTGAIAEQLLILLYRKYGKRKALKITKEQLRFADIDSKMRKYARTVLYLRTKELLGQGIHFKIEKSDLLMDAFDLSKMIVYGNYPFNKGTDYNYLAKLFRQQMKYGLSLGVFIVDSATIDPRKVQSKKILGDFFNCIEVVSKIDFNEVACDISMIRYDRIQKTNKSMIDMERFTTSKDFGLIFKMLPGFNIAYSFKDGSKIFRNDFDVDNSVLFMHQKDLTLNKDVKLRIPSPNAPESSCERELYLRWMKEIDEYPSIEQIPFQLLLGKLITDKKEVAFRLFKDSQVCGTHTIIRAVGDVSKLSVFALILTSNVFKTKLFEIFPKEHTGYGLRINLLKTLPIPKQIPERLYEIGQKLIIEGIEDEKLRKEADKIIAELYKALEI